MMAEAQLLHLVIGGELEEVSGTRFRDLSKLDYVGAFPSYAAALQAWRARAQASVDNAHMRYFIIHAHKLLDPSAQAPSGEDGPATTRVPAADR